MSALIDVDQLRTFIAIVETGSFTKAAEVVHKTQSAVSMQMKRLEERLGKAIFARDGRASKLTDDGDRLLDYARRIIKLNVEALASFDDAELAGRVRLGLPDDYADRYLPEIMARFSRAYPSVELTVMCEPSVELVERIDSNELDLAIVTDCGTSRASEVVPPRTAAVGDVEPALDSSRGAVAARARTAELRLAARRHRMPGDDGATASHRLHQRQRQRGGLRRAIGTRGFDLSGIGIATRHARAQSRRRLSGTARLPRRTHPQSAREPGARRRARRAHHLVAGQSFGSGSGAEETFALGAAQASAAQYAYSSKIGSTEPFHGPWYFSSNSSAGVMPRATISWSGRR